MASNAPQTREARFLRIYDTHVAWLARTLRRLGVRPGDIEDLTHDVCVVVHRRLDEFGADDPERPWLYAIAVRVVSDYRRRASFSREQALDPTFDETPCDSDPEAAHEAKRQRALVLRSLDALNEAQRIVFVAHDLDGLTIPELVGMLDVPLNTLYSRLRLARQNFRTEVERRLKAGESA